MLTRLHVDNYKCLVNFDFRPKQIQLIFGSNGTGKSAAFSALSAIRGLVSDALPVVQVFPESTRTRWMSVPTQSIRIECTNGKSEYSYELQIDIEKKSHQPRVLSEVVTVNGTPRFEFLKGEVQLYRDNGSKGPPYSFDWFRSAFSGLLRRQDNSELFWLRDWLAGLYSISLQPSRIGPRAERASRHPDPTFEAFAAWYMHCALEQPQDTSELQSSLREALPSFRSLMLREAGDDARSLKAEFEADGAMPYIVDFGELSDGQRALVCLYTVMHCAVKPSATLCFDEPDNFIALEEIQPWLNRIRSRVEDRNAQMIIVSHHPEFLDQLAAAEGCRFERRGSGTVVENFKPDPSGLSPSQLVARRWISA